MPVFGYCRLLSASAALQEEEEEEGGGEEGTSWKHGSLSAFPAVTSRQVVFIEMKRAKRGQLTDWFIKLRLLNMKKKPHEKKSFKATVF